MTECQNVQYQDPGTKTTETNLALVIFFFNPLSNCAFTTVSKYHLRKNGSDYFPFLALSGFILLCVLTLHVSLRIVENVY